MWGDEPEHRFQDLERRVDDLEKLTSKFDEALSRIKALESLLTVCPAQWVAITLPVGWTIFCSKCGEEILIAQLCGDQAELKPHYTNGLLVEW